MNSLELTTRTSDLLDMVGQVAETMLDCPVTSSQTFSSAQLRAAAPTHAFDIALSAGEQSFAVMLACSESSATALASKMTGKDGTALSSKLIDDAMAEWLNVLAGQIKSLNALDHAMGLPRRTSSTELLARETSGLRVEFAGTPAALFIGITGASLRP